MWNSIGFSIAFFNSLKVAASVAVCVILLCAPAAPRELDESVLVDGGRYLDVLRHIIVPLSRPGLMTIGAFAFTTAWGEYLLALSLITSDDKWTLPLALQGAMAQNTVDLGALTAGGVMISLPVAVLFMVLQRSLVAGLTAGSVKG